MPKKRPLQNQTILITGCSSGIGYDCAKTLKNLGSKVIATCRKVEDVQRLKEEGFECFQLDLADSKHLHLQVEEILTATEHHIDALFNNAAFGLPGAVEDLSREALRYQFEINVFGTQELTNLILPVMHQQGHGKILYNSSILGFAAMPFRGAYNASKFAIEGLADTLRLELANTNIEIILIEPGPIQSKFRHNAYQQFKKWIPFKTSRYRAHYDNMIKRLAAEEGKTPFTLGPEAVTQSVIHALTHSPAKIRYRITVPTKAFAILKRFLPTKLLDKLLLKAGGDGKN
jgi:short-subunit dehydrogenase